MTHGDDDGIILPPKVAPAQVVLLPIFRKEGDRQQVMDYVTSLAAELRAQSYAGRPVGVEIDDREIGGARGWDWIRKGIPVRVEIGPRDIEQGAVFFGRRDRGHREKTAMERNRFVREIPSLLEEIQQHLYDEALAFRQTHTRQIDDKEAFWAFFTPKNEEDPEIHGGFSNSHWCGQAACETRIKEELAVTIRCIPLDAASENGRCICCGQPSDRRVVFAKAY
jgi:prolyl-tRNA synthetase